MITRNGKVMAFQEEPVGIADGGPANLCSVKAACNIFFRSRGLPQSLSRLGIETLAKNSSRRPKKTV